MILGKDLTGRINPLVKGNSDPSKIKNNFSLKTLAILSSLTLSACSNNSDDLYKDAIYDADGNPYKAFVILKEEFSSASPKVDINLYGKNAPTELDAIVSARDKVLYDFKECFLIEKTFEFNDVSWKKYYDSWDKSYTVEFSNNVKDKNCIANGYIYGMFNSPIKADAISLKNKVSEINDGETNETISYLKLLFKHNKSNEALIDIIIQARDLIYNESGEYKEKKPKDGWYYSDNGFIFNDREKNK